MDPYRALFRMFGGIPLSIRAALFERIALCAWALNRERHRIARINLQIAFPEMEESEAARISRLCFLRLGTTAAEFVHIPKMGAEYVRGHFRIEGLEHFERTEKELGLGAIAITGHVGNWELLAHAYGTIVSPGAFVTGTLKNESLDAIVTERRQLSGNRVIRKSGSAKEVIRAIRRRTMVGILIDRNVKPSKGVLVDFFSRKAFTSDAVARLALAMKTNIHSAFIFRDPHRKFHHTLRLGPHIPIDPDAPREEEVVRVMGKCNHELETAIRRDPTQWIWFYRRWQTKGKKADGAVDIYDRGFRTKAR